MATRSYLRDVAEIVTEAQAEIDGGAELTPGLLAEAHLMLPYYAACYIARQTGRWDILEDLISTGVLALYDAAAGYEPSHGEFAPYARTAIERRLWGTLAVERAKGTASVSVARKARRLAGELKSRQEAEEPTDPYSMAQALGVRVETVIARLRLVQSFVSLDTPSHNYDDDEEKKPLAHTIADQSAGPEAVVLDRIEAEERKELLKAVSQLPDTVRAALGLTTGYPTFDRMSLGDLVAASRHHRQQGARERLRKKFKEGEANAYRLGFAPEDATGPGTGQRLPSPTPIRGQSDQKKRDSPADIWQRLTDRWRQAAEMDTGQCVGG